MKLRRTTLMSALILCAFAAVGCGGSHESPPAAEAAPAEQGKAEGQSEKVTLSADAVAKAGIQVEPAMKSTLVGMVTAPARVTFNSEKIAHVGSPLIGRVADIKVRVGDTLKQGDALMVIYSPGLGEAQSDYLLKRTAVETAKPAIDLTKAVYERGKALNDTGEGLSLTIVQQREADYRAAVAALQAAQAAERGAKDRLQILGMDQKAIEALQNTGNVDPRCTVCAPISGQVIEREATLGELVSPDREALLVLADMTTLWVLADVPEAQMGLIAIGADARVTVPALVNKEFHGTVTYVSPRLDSNTRTSAARIEVTGDKTGLRPGMFVQAEISVVGEHGQDKSVLAIPEEATQLVEGATVVFVPVPNEENTFAKRAVTVGPVVGRMMPVLKGLKEGEKFVVAGSFILKAELGKAAATED